MDSKDLINIVIDNFDLEEEQDVKQLNLEAYLEEIFAFSY